MAKQNVLGEFEYALTKVQDLHWEVTSKKIDPKFRKMLHKGDTSEADFRNATTIGLGQHLLVGEGGKVPYDTFVKGRERVTTWKNFMLGYRATKNLVRDMKESGRVRKDTMKMFAGLQKRLRKSANWTEETIGANMLLKADIATRDDLWPGVGGDGKPLAAANHQNKKGVVKTMSNRQTSATLSDIVLAELVSMLHKILDEAGMPSGAPDKIDVWLPIYWEWRKIEIMRSEKRLDANISNVNVIAEEKGRFNWMINEYFGPDTMSFAVTDPDEHMLEYYEKQEPEFDSDRDFQTKGLLFSSDFRFSIDHQDWRWAAFNLT